MSNEQKEDDFLYAQILDLCIRYSRELSARMVPEADVVIICGIPGDPNNALVTGTMSIEDAIEMLKSIKDRPRVSGKL